MLPRNVHVILISLIVALFCYSVVAKTRKAVMVGEAIQLIDQFYVDPVNDAELVEAAMNGITSTLDEHTEFIPPTMYGAFQDVIEQQFAGIGILVEQPEPEKPVRVITPLVGSPALAAGLLPGDRILNVNGTDVSRLPIGEVSNLLRGPVGTSLSITIGREQNGTEQRLDLSITRQTIALESVVGDHRGQDNQWVFHIHNQPEIAYIRVTSFGEKTVAEFRAVIDALPPSTQSLIIDVRANSGGLLNAAVDLCDDFLDSGRIVTIKRRGGEIDSEYDARPGVRIRKDLPTVVLIDGNSASASEIVAACLQDHQRAVVVGSRSYGKGTVQNVLVMDYGRSALKLTTARYYRPNGRNIHRLKDATDEDEWGVTPDKDMQVVVDDETYKKLIQTWQAASFPVLSGSPKSDQDSDPEIVDEALRKAVEYLQTKPQVPLQSLPKAA